MREQGGRVYVSLATVGDVAAEGESVVHAARLGARLGNELQRQSSESVKLPVLNLEVRYQGAASVRRKHSCLLGFSRNRAKRNSHRSQSSRTILIGRSDFFLVLLVSSM